MNALLTLVVRFLVLALSVFVVAKVMPGMRVKKFTDAVWFSLVVAVLNVLAWKVFGLVTLPFAAVTAGLGYFFLNGVIFLVAKRVVSGVEISGCLVASIAAALVSFLNTTLTHVLH